MSRKLEFLITLLGDIILLVLAFVISWKAADIYMSLISSHALIGNFSFLFFWLFLFQSFNLYRTRSQIQIINELSRLFKVLCLGMIIIFSLAFLFNINFIKAPGFIPAYIITLSSLIVWRFMWRGIVGEYFKPKPEKVLIFQNGDAVEHNSKFNIIEKIRIDRLNPDIPDTLLKNNNIKGIVIESNGSHKKDIMHLMSKFADARYEIFVSPRIYPLIYQYFLVKKMPDSPLLKVIFHPLSNWDRFLKRIIDILIASISLIVLSPILAIISILIIIDSPGSILYKQQRVGLRGNKFTLYKFRSMVSDAEKNTGPVWASKNDTRITRVGRFLRPFRLDELPQLLNVLKGDMSFVGPRPERPAFVKNLQKEIPLYNLRLNVLPGITGLAQIKHNYDQTVDDVKKKLEYDLEYINNMSLKLDLKIFLKTILTVVKKEGAH